MGYRPMTDEEWWAFLVAEPRPAILSTVRADGRPHAAPIWIVVEDGAVVFNTGDATVKGRNIARDPRVSIVVQDDRPPFSYVAVEGVAETSDDLAEVKRVATRIGGRYMGEAVADQFGERNGVPGELVVRVRPTKVVAVRDVAD
jgi:PPOX class probable F420-dependent enzyme